MGKVTPNNAECRLNRVAHIFFLDVFLILAEVKTYNRKFYTVSGYRERSDPRSCGIIKWWECFFSLAGTTKLVRVNWRDLDGAHIQDNPENSLETAEYETDKKVLRFEQDKEPKYTNQTYNSILYFYFLDVKAGRQMLQKCL